MSARRYDLLYRVEAIVSAPEKREEKKGGGKRRHFSTGCFEKKVLLVPFWEFLKYWRC